MVKEIEIKDFKAYIILPQYVFNRINTLDFETAMQLGSNMGYDNPLPKDLTTNAFNFNDTPYIFLKEWRRNGRSEEG